MKPNVHQFPEHADPATLLQYKIAVMQDYADGAQIEARVTEYGEALAYRGSHPMCPADDCWHAVTAPTLLFNWASYDYRVAEPKLAAGRNRSGLTEDEVGVNDDWRLLTEEEHAANRKVRDTQYLQSDGTWSRTGAYYTDAEDLRTQKPAGYFLPKKPTTVLGWLCTLPEGYKQRAVKNLDAHMAEVSIATLHGAVMAAFTWDDTPEGLDFWSSLYDWALNPETYKLPALPAEKPTDEQAYSKWVTDASITGRYSCRSAFEAGVRHGRATS